MAQSDVLVIGAGAAGLAAAHLLSGSGVSVTVLEARDRIGGRIYTTRPEGTDLPVELGADFVHGRPHETFAIAQSAGLRLYEFAGNAWISDGGQLSRGVDEEDEDDGDEVANASAGAERDDEYDEYGEYDGMGVILGAISKWRGEDRSFQAFVDEQFPGARWVAARRSASSYVEGFDAAYPDRVSVHWLAQTEMASASTDGGRQFRILDGYDRVPTWLRDALSPERATLRLNAVVREIRWSPGHVEVGAYSPDGTALEPYTARAAVVTLPLGVLAAPPEAPGVVRFSPEPPDKRDALEGLEMGHTVKVVLRFREQFWDAIRPASTSRPRLPQLPRLSFLFSGDDVIPTWWTHYPVLTPMLTAWVGGPRAVRLASNPDEAIADQALGALARALSVRRGDLDAQLAAWYVHNWSTDPFARGAYSYVRVGGLEAPGRLATPVEGTLFFAGEATDTEGHTGTVHAALASGTRAAREVLAQFDSTRNAAG
jgi:monoamine oxidase